MSRLHVAVQLLPPPHHGPTGLVERFETAPEDCAVRLARFVELAALDGTLANGGCLSITVQRVPARPEGGA
jgi:hypothetical protein